MTFSRCTGAAIAAAFACGLAAPAAHAFQTPAEIEASAQRAVSWYDTQQEPDGTIGYFGADWSLLALSDAGKNPADLKVPTASRSLQDVFAEQWSDPSSYGYGDQATDAARALLVGRGGGIQVNRLGTRSSDNVVAQMAGFFDGSQFGNRSQINDDIFALLGTRRTGAITAVDPLVTKGIRAAQVADSRAGAGWNYTTNPKGSPDVDMTGAGIASLCAAGATADDPAIAKALTFLKGHQDTASGGFTSSFFGVNSDSTAWVVRGLRQCGIDPQSAAWTTTAGKTPLDSLVALQKPSGAYRYLPSEDAGDPDNLYSTQDVLSALTGTGFGNDPAPRSDASKPAFRPAPAVPAGTDVPLTLVLDHGPAQAGAERVCSVTAPVGATVGEVLSRAEQATTPAYCVGAVQTSGVTLKSLNGTTAEPGATRWEARVDGGAARTTLDQPVALGSTVALTLTGTPSEPAPAAPLPLLNVPQTPVSPSSATPGRRPAARAVLGSVRTRRVSRGGVTTFWVRCPAGVGSAGCRGALRVTYAVRSKDRLHRVTAGSAGFSVASGKRKLVAVRIRGRLARAVRSSARGSSARIEALVRGDDGAVRTTRAAVRLHR